MFHSYSDIFALGHKAVLDIFADEVVLEEKIDGSQFSFGLHEGRIQCRSKNTEQFIDAPDGLFQKAVDVVKTLPLHPNYIYRAEYLQKPKPPLAVGVYPR